VEEEKAFTTGGQIFNDFLDQYHNALVITIATRSSDQRNMPEDYLETQVYEAITNLNFLL
jgi:hypothetical protein